MKLLRLLSLFSFAFLTMTSFAYSQTIEVSMPDTATGEPNTSVTIPIVVGELTGRNVLSYQAVIVFDEGVLDATGASSVGTLSESFGQPTVDTSVDGEVFVAASGASPLSGSGTLVNLIFNVVGQPGEMTDLQFVGFLFNTGDPPAVTTNGKFIVRSAAVPEIAVHPTSHDFGDVIVDSTASQTFVVTNEGTAVLVVTATSLTGANPEQFNIDSGGAPFTLVPGDSQDVVVSFQPTSEGLKSATLQIASNDPDEDTLEVALTGNGVPA
ncbi:MAG: choice-of-anchor D domain-containing protein, partial [bacterium]